ncbi:MAG: valyl-tRNA synthetase, partial [Solirubrobacteraceae bacterium]|nr:valyl-tRNA synthetase [Solirubrobacteraceae bacterium]
GLLATSSSQDVRFNEDKVGQGRQLANKLYNASRLVLLRVPEGLAVPAAAPRPAAVEDAWILSRLQAAIAEVSRAIGAFEFHHAALGLYDFVYGELCDWYLELVKPRLYEDDNRHVSELALYVLAETLALAHPLIPFVTEEIWAHMPGEDGLLMARRFPEADPALTDGDAEAEIAGAIEAVQELRGWRDRVGAVPGRTIPARLDAEGYGATAAHVARLARFELSGGDGEPVATVTVPGGSVAVFESDAVDAEAEARRTLEHRAHLESEIARAESKLANQRFVERAPAAVVESERGKLARLHEELRGLA